MQNLTIIMCSFMFVQFGSLKDYHWKNRVVIEFINEDIQNYDSNWQVELEQLAERDLVVIHVSLLDSSVQVVYGMPKESLEANELIQDFNRELKQKQVLIGKDGGLKWEGSTTNIRATVLNLVDKMPMRKWEMKQ